MAPTCRACHYGFWEVEIMGLLFPETSIGTDRDRLPKLRHRWFVATVLLAIAVAIMLWSAVTGGGP
jgi:hypothetical protein